MESIVQYKAKDGKIFETEEKCLEYEALCKVIEEIMSTLPSTPDGDNCTFTNGDGYIQHDGQAFLRARERLLLLAMRYSNHKSLQQAIDNGIGIGPSFAGRIIDDGCPRVLNKAWHRIMNTGQDFREYGQCYFRLHPQEAKQIQLN